MSFGRGSHSLDIGDRSLLVVPLDNVAARFVRLLLPGKGRRLHLDEVEIYGLPTVRHDRMAMLWHRLSDWLRAFGRHPRRGGRVARRGERP